jgi:hypothetical protein
MANVHKGEELIEHSRFVYDMDSGRILHTYHIGAPQGVILPQEDEVDELAIKEAMGFTGKERGRLGVVRFDRKVLKAGIVYSVDRDRKCLVEGPREVGRAFVGALEPGSRRPS